jgi:hypothetical protein
VKLNRNTIGTVVLAQEVFSVKSMTEDTGGSITVQSAVYRKNAHSKPETWADRGDGQPRAQKSERVRKLIKEKGCQLLFLPPYSADLNPIEEAFSKIKGLS